MIENIENEERDFIDGEVAHHEAGHAVAMLQVGVAFGSVTIVPSGEAAGQVDILGSPEMRLPVREDEGGMLMTRNSAYDDYVMFTLAGPVAQARFLGFGRDFEGFAGHNDVDTVVSMLRSVSGSPDELLEIYESLLRRAQEFVWSDTPWAGITEVAAALTQRQTLNHSEVQDLVAGATSSL